MITEVSIKNIALSDKLEFELKPGLNVFTGETGAGKSLVISAIAFSLGLGSEFTRLRSDSENSIITLTIDASGISGLDGILEDAGIDCEENEIIITRNISPDGKTKNYVNGVKAAVATLQKIGARVVEISGQNDELLLSDPGEQLYLLDRYCGGELAELKSKLAEKYRELKSLMDEREELKKSESERAREIDLYSYQVKEIKESGIYENEDAELNERVEFLKNAEHISKIRGEILSLLDGDDENTSVLSGLSKVNGLLSKLGGFDHSFNSSAAVANDAYYTLKDISESVNSLSGALDYSEDELNGKIERQHFLSTLKRKYGATIPDILKYLETVENKLSTLLNFDMNFSRINDEIDNLFEEYKKIAGKITDIRMVKKDIIESEIDRELSSLDMKNANFKVAVKPIDPSDASKVSAFGLETIEFMIRTNPGMPFSSLAKTASGGEMSRVMLAIKNVLSSYSMTPTIIFDEIDTGIGGFTLNAVGEKLKTISSGKQVVCITHSPIIASFAKNHYMVKKQVVNNEKTVINISGLNESEVEYEIARMLGNDSDIGISHAREIISKNKN